MRSKTIRVAVSALAVGTVGVLLAGCGAGDSPAEGEFTVTMAALQPAPSFDPAVINNGPLYNYAASAYETLVFPEADGTLTPGIATEWEYIDNTTLTMDIRDDVVFVDGTGLDADLVVANIERYRTTPGPYQSRMNSIDTVTAVDDDSIEFILNTPDLSLPQAFSLTPGMMVSQAAIDDPSILQSETAGSGPWMLDEYIDGSEYTYVRNPEYSGPLDVEPDVLRYVVITDLTAQLNALLAGDVDITVAQWTQRETAEQQGMAAVGGESNVGGLWLMDREGEVVPALGDVRVRQAINHAIDRESLGEALWSTFQRPTAQVFGTSTNAYDESLDDYYEYDPDRARELLAEAGYADGFDLPILSRTTFGDSARLEATLPFLQEVGINATIVDRTNDYYDAMAAKEFAAAQSQQNGVTDAYVGASNLLVANSQVNPFGVTDPELDALMADAAAELDADAAAEKWQAVSAWVVENAWFAPISYYHTHNLYNPETLAGVELSAGQTVALPFTWVRP
ncbi:ABC transporter substrate-binding protein [Marisediminicola sp. LYQ134]|uniref:ABC transporter substrate-binding protein n=1 Tax=Marisediminicola sp. LYQ134 TaxID=3391061 RepID=UPI003983D464